MAAAAWAAGRAFLSTLSVVMAATVKEMRCVQMAVKAAEDAFTSRMVVRLAQRRATRSIRRTKCCPRPPYLPTAAQTSSVFGSRACGRAPLSVYSFRMLRSASLWAAREPLASVTTQPACSTAVRSR